LGDSDRYNEPSLVNTWEYPISIDAKTANIPTKNHINNEFIVVDAIDIPFKSNTNKIQKERKRFYAKCIAFLVLFYFFESLLYIIVHADIVCYVTYNNPYQLIYKPSTLMQFSLSSLVVPLSKIHSGVMFYITSAFTWYFASLIVDVPSQL
jgi:hypothetical protein